jgi:cell division protein FtsB
MILGMCFGGIVTLTFICSDLRRRIEVLERNNRKLKRDIEKLLENDIIENGSTTK